MRDAAAVVHRILGHQHAEIEGERVDDAAAHAAARRAAGDDERVGLQVDQVARERRGEERARVLLRDQDLAGLRRDLRDEVVAAFGDRHDGGYLLGEATAVGRLLRRDVRIQDRPAAPAELREEELDVPDGAPGDLAAARRKLLDRFPERHRRGAHGPVLHVDDQQRRARADPARAAEARRAVGPLLLLADDAVPRSLAVGVHGCSRLAKAASPSRAAVSLFQFAVAVEVHERLPPREGDELGLGAGERAALVQVAQDPRHREHRALQRGVGVEDPREAEAPELLARQHRRLAPEHDVADVNARHGGRNAGELLDRLRRLDEQHVGARFPVRRRPLERAVEPLDRVGIGARDDEEACVAPRVDRRLDLLHHLRGGNDVLAVEVPAALREDLVLELERVRACALERAHRALEVERIAEPGVRVDDDRDRHRLADRRDVGGHLGGGRESEIGGAEMRVRNSRAGDIDERETGGLDDPGGERVESARDDRPGARRKVPAELSGQRLGHGGRRRA